MILDIGTEAVKAIIVKKSLDKVSICGSSVQYFDDEGVFDKGFTAEDFEIEIIREAVLKAAKEAFLEFALIVKNKGVKKESDLPVLLTLSPTILKAAVVDEFSIRDKKEKKISKKEQEIIYRYILKSAKDDVSNLIFKESGILAKDVEFICLTIISKQIEGYFVENIQNYQGRNLGFKILSVFIPGLYFKRITGMISSLGFKNLKIVHLSQAIGNVFLEKKGDYAFLDIGGEVCQIFLMKNGFLDKIEFFDKGGEDFTERIFDVLMVNKAEARNLKERYSANSLTPETKKRIEGLLSNEKDVWREGLKKYKKTSVFLFGGGSNLYEVKDIFRRRKIIHVQDIKKAEDLTKKTKSPQFTPAVLISLI